MTDRLVMVITGTSKGIGRGMAEYFVQRGYQVAGCSRGPATLDMAHYHHSQVDVGDEQQVRRWIRSVKNEFQRIDVLVCNAGHVRAALLMTVTPGDILEMFLHTHLKGTYYVCREVAKAMILQTSGRIITISSITVPLHLEGTSAYSATKSGIIEMTKVLALELAPMGITCNVIAPGLIMTEPAQALGQEWANRLLEKQAIKRVFTIEEICHIVSFLAAPESSCITGQVIHMGWVN